jgi:hypothetical protein
MLTKARNGKSSVLLNPSRFRQLTRALRLEEKGCPPVYYFGLIITPIVPTRAIAPTTAFPLAKRNRKMPFGRAKGSSRGGD